MNEITAELIQLISYVKELAPHIWEIAVKQVYVEIWNNVAVAIVAVLAEVVAYKLFQHGVNSKKEDFYNNWEFSYVPGIVLLAVSVFLFLDSIFSIVPRLINPQYYAIQILLEMIK